MKEEERLKELMVDIRLLQRTCQAFDYPALRPKKFAHFQRIEHAQALQDSLLTQFHELEKIISPRRFVEIETEASQILRKIEDQELADSQFYKNSPVSFRKSTRSRDDIENENQHNNESTPRLSRKTRSTHS